MSKPEIIDVPGGYRFTWQSEKVTALVSHLHQHRDGRVSAEVRVSLLEAANNHVAQRQFSNIQGDRGLKDFRSTLEEVYNGIQWQTIVEQLAVYTVERLRQGEPATEVVTAIEDPLQEDVRYLLAPLLLEHKPVMLYGEGGSGKTQLAALTLVCVSLPWYNNALGLTTAERSNCLVLDWENEVTDWRRLVNSICRGMELPNVAFWHRRCVQPLADDMEAVQNMVAEHQIGYIIMDSLGEAAGGGDGNLSENQSALRFFHSLRGLERVTPFLIHHTSKTQEGHKTPYGSVYFFNMARSVWEIKAQREPGSPRLDIGLFHRKANFSQFSHPLSYRLQYSAGGIAIHRSEVAEMFEDQLTETGRLKSLLRHGSKTVAQIMEETGKTDTAVRSLLNKYKDTFVRQGDGWALAEKRET